MSYVGLMAMLMALDNGFQACLMAPTEILARQHEQGITEYVEGLDINVGFLSGTVKGKKRKALLESLAAGEIDILIGTHALIEDPVVFKQHQNGEQGNENIVTEARSRRTARTRSRRAATASGSSGSSATPSTANDHCSSG